MTLLESLIAARRERGLTQRAISEQLGVSAPAVSMWESGAREIALYRLEQYAEVVGLRIVAVPESAA